MLTLAFRAFAETFSPPLRRILLRSIGLAVLLLIALGVLLDWALTHYIDVPYAWLATTLAVVAGLGTFVGAIFLIAPVSSVVAALFLDEVAEIVERRDYPADPVGQALPIGQAIWLSARFFVLVVIVNALALLLLLVPGVNAVVFLVANAYLLSREFFELAAMRFRPGADAYAMRRFHAGRIFIAGLPIAVVATIPILNLITPVFGTAYMVHLHKWLSKPG
jgi:CysZ protein